MSKPIVTFTSTAAAKYRRELDYHKWILRERIGRDVGIRVAAIDYFENIQGRKTRTTLWQRLKDSYQKWMECRQNGQVANGPASLIRFEMAMRGTRSLAH